MPYLVPNIASLAGAAALTALSIRQYKFARDFKPLREPHAGSRVNSPVNLMKCWPRVSLIVPACNEGATIRPALESLLEMDYPDLELIVVNDRSSDDTGKIIHELAAKNPVIKPIDIKTLPAGWLGKVHALEQGVRASTGDWLLFSDADVHYKKDCLRNSVAFCEQGAHDFLTLTPDVHATRAALSLVVTLFSSIATVALNVRSVHDPANSMAVGIGAFTLLRKSAYARTPGLEWIKLDVVDDSGVAYMMKTFGARCAVRSGLDEIALEWYPTFRAFVRGLEKNAFALLQYSLPALLLFTLLTFLFVASFTIAPILSGNFWVCAATALALCSFFLTSALSLRKLIRFKSLLDYWKVIALPFAFPLLALIAARAATLFLFRGGIEWRGVFYSRQALLGGQRLKPIDVFLARAAARR